MGKFIHSMVTAAIVGLPISGSPVLAWDAVVISDPSTSVLYQTHACNDFKVPFSFKLYGFTLDSTVGEVGNHSSPKREIDVFFVTVGGFKTTDDQGNPIAVDFS